MPLFSIIDTISNTSYSTVLALLARNHINAAYCQIGAFIIAFIIHVKNSRFCLIQAPKTPLLSKDNITVAAAKSNAEETSCQTKACVKIWFYV